MASYTNPSDVLSDIRRSTVFTPLANFAASISSITDATRAIRRIKTSEINELMKKMPGWERDGWKRTSQYGLQRMWQRSKVEDKDENLLDKI